MRAMRNVCCFVFGCVTPGASQPGFREKRVTPVVRRATADASMSATVGGQNAPR